MAALKLTDGSKLFYSMCPELRLENVTWEKFKEMFRKRYKDVRADQFHIMKLWMARQGKNEDPQQFTDMQSTVTENFVQGRRPTSPAYTQ